MSNPRAYHSPIHRKNADETQVLQGVRAPAPASLYEAQGRLIEMLVSERALREGVTAAKKPAKSKKAKAKA